MSEILYSAIVLSLVLITSGLGLSAHQARDMHRDAVAALFILIGFIGLFGSIAFAVVL